MSIYLCIYIHLFEYLYFYCNSLHLFKICLCCFLDMHLYSKNLSIITTISSLIILELLPACFSCSINFNLSHNSLGSDDENIVFEKPEAIIVVILVIL